MIGINYRITKNDFKNKLVRFWNLSGKKILEIEKEFQTIPASPVLTIHGKYNSRGWTEWTRGFQYGSAILQYEASNDPVFLAIGREGVLNNMASHISHTGVHDHGFNNLSTYGNLLRLMKEDFIPDSPWERNFYQLALKISGAVQASRWTKLNDGGFIYSFNGPHSLFIDTIRSVRILMVSHLLGHELMGEGDQKINLMDRAIHHIETTAKYSVFYGEGRDIYDVPGRIAHESIFNTHNASYRCPGSQQGYSAYTTWMRGLSWAILGFSEELELFHQLNEGHPGSKKDLQNIIKLIARAAKLTCDYYIENSPVDGIPYWDSGAPGLSRIPDYLNKPADPFNLFEPVDSSAAVIAAQGFLRLGNYFRLNNQAEEGEHYFQAGLTIFDRILSDDYLSDNPDHQGLILHSIYHRPNGWDNKPANSQVPCGESSMWGDYHARELAMYLGKLIDKGPYYTFYNYVI